MSHHTMLDNVLSVSPSSVFQDSDGLISFVNLSSGYVVNSPEFKTGQTVCDKVSNFFATLRSRVFGALQSGKVQPIPGDAKPNTQWDDSVTNFMQNMCQEAGGFTNFSTIHETYSHTVAVQEFSTAFIKLIFDAVVVPEAIIGDVVNFMQSVGESLRASWDDKQRSYQNVLLGQCHEAIPEDNSGKNFRYYPKIKNFHIDMTSSQQEFRTSCSRTRLITFNFNYSYYVTGLDAELLSPKTKLYKDFVEGFLGRAQQENYKHATNNLNSVLAATPSASPSKLIGLKGESAVNLSKYPLITVA